MFWHAGDVEQYEDRYSALAQYFDEVHVVVPKGWREVDQGDLSASAYQVTMHKTPATLCIHPLTILLKRPSEEIGKFSPDLIYIHEEPHALTTFQVAWSAVQQGIPYIVDSSVINRRGNLFQKNPLEQFVFRHASLVYYRNDQCRSILQDRGCPVEKLQGPMPNGVSVDTFCEVGSKEALQFVNERLSASIQNKNLLIGFAGKICYRKGIDTLLNAIKESGSMHVLLCGPIIEDSYRHKINENPSAEYLGNLETYGLVRFYSACDLIVLPSISTPAWEEQFGRVLTEAIACGTPAIGSDVGMISQIVGEGAIFPQENSDALIQMIEQFRPFERRQNLIDKQRARMKKKYTWKAVAEHVYSDASSLVSR